jgi:hypothetical protein
MSNVDKEPYPESVNKLRRAISCSLIFSCLVPILLISAVAIYFFSGSQIRLSGSYRQALQAARNNKDVAAALGEPVIASFGAVEGKIKCKAGTCTADYTFPLHGSREEGHLIVKSTSSDAGFLHEGIWTLNAIVNVEGGSIYELIPTPPPKRMLSSAQADATEGAILQATRRAQATLDAQALATQSEATARAVSNAQVEATETAVTKATAQAIAATQAPWPVLINETFTNNTLGWTLGTQEDEAVTLTTAISGRKLWVTINPQKGGAFWNMTPANGQAFSDFDAQVTLELVQANTQGRYAFGLVFCHTDNDYGFLGLTDDGHFVVLAVFNSNIFQYILDSSPAIDPTAENRLAVRALENNYIFLVNDQIVWQMEENFPEGEIGLGVEVMEAGDQAQAAFTNLIVRAPK